jgi:signal peptidase II
MTPKLRRISLVFSILVLTMGLDQATKVLARQSLSAQSLSYLGGIVQLQHSENPGAFLSLGADMDPQTRMIVFTIAVAIVLLASVWTLFKKADMNTSTTVSLSLVVAGGLGNLIDRAIKGTVTDFMFVGFNNSWLRTGIFNVADMAIMAGMAVLIFASFRPEPTPVSDPSKAA